MQRLKGRTVIVTGAASGIGAAIAELFAVEGAHVVGVDLDKPLLEKVIRTLRETSRSFQGIAADIAQSDQVSTMVEDVVADRGTIHVLVNNAGVDQPVVPVAEMDEALWDHIMNINARGTFLCSRYVLPYMIEAGGGVIVNVASDLGYVVVPGLGAYCSSKGAILQLTRVMAAENGRHNIRVNALCPTMIDTPMAQRTLRTHPDTPAWLQEIESSIPLGRIGTAQEVAKAALFLASEDAAFVNGACLPIDGGRTVL